MSTVCAARGFVKRTSCIGAVGSAQSLQTRVAVEMSARGRYSRISSRSSGIAQTRAQADSAIVWLCLGWLFVVVVEPKGDEASEPVHTNYKKVWA